MKIILGVTGGIAAYKACELVRLFKKAGHEVRVVMTASAEKFVGPLTFHSLSGEPVLRSLHEGAYDLSATSHIELAQWGDALVVAPATANFLAKFASGQADDALLTEALAFQGPIFLAPAMNTRMWEAEITQANLALLHSRVRFIGPVSGDLACGETGEGKMSEPMEIFQAVTEKPLLSGLKILVTSGPTRACIDSVRYLTNRSSGRMGHALAKRAAELGAEVVLVTGPVEEKYAKAAKVKTLKVETAEEMLAACLPELEGSDLVIAAAAVADFRMPEVLPGKLRREGSLSLEMIASADVLAELGKRKKPGQIFMGFAAEAGEGEAEFAKAREKIQKKNLDFLALNNVSRKDIGFDVSENEIYLFAGKEAPIKLPKAAKASIAELLLKTAAEKLKKQTHSPEARA
jgi:phosphopantothenoylcysteine decarboxylase/phosphopantothenate--cysteine ligase